MSAARNVHPDDLQAIRVRMAKVPVADSAAFRLRARHTDGRWLTLELVGYDRFDDPEVGGLVISGFDITSRLAAEEALQAERARLELLLDTARALGSALDREGILHILAKRIITGLGAAGASFTEIDRETGTIHSSVHQVAPRRAPMKAPAERPRLSTYPFLEQTVQSGIPP
jgi:PAS domain-containing protein